MTYYTSFYIEGPNEQEIELEVIFDYDNPTTFEITPLTDTNIMLEGSGECKMIRRNRRIFSIIPTFTPQVFTLLQFSFRVKQVRRVVVAIIQLTPAGFTVTEIEVRRGLGDR